MRYWQLAAFLGFRLILSIPTGYFSEIRFLQVTFLPELIHRGGADNKWNDPLHYFTIFNLMLKIDYPSLTGVIVIGIDWYQFSIINRTNVNIHLPLALINSIHTQLPKAA